MPRWTTCEVKHPTCVKCRRATSIHNYSPGSDACIYCVYGITYTTGGIRRDKQLAELVGMKASDAALALARTNARVKIPARKQPEPESEDEVQAYAASESGYSEDVKEESPKGKGKMETTIGEMLLGLATQRDELSVKVEKMKVELAMLEMELRAKDETLGMLRSLVEKL